MAELKNSDILKGVLQGLYKVTGRRTTLNFAIAVIGAIIRTLEQKYVFLGYIDLNKERTGDDIINISSKINKVHPARLGKAVEAIIQVVYMDLKEKAGLYFIKELKRSTGENIINALKEVGVDLELLQLQQHYLYRRQQRTVTGKGAGGKGKVGKQLDNVSLLGYSWDKVKNWKYDSKKKTCVLYGIDGKKLDTLNLDTIVKNYVGSITDDGIIGPLREKDDEEDGGTSVSDKEFELLKMLHVRDIDAETAIALLRVTEKELNYMIRRLLILEMLQYISQDEVELTETGIEHLKTKNNKKEEEQTVK